MVLERIEEGWCELRFFDDPSSPQYRAWKMTAQEVADLARWWTAAGARLDAPQLPVRDVEVRDMRISMQVPAWITIERVDQYGRKGMSGWMFPREVMEGLARSSDQCK